MDSLVSLYINKKVQRVVIKFHVNIVISRKRVFHKNLYHFVIK